MEEHKVGFRGLNQWGLWTLGFRIGKEERAGRKSRKKKVPRKINAVE